MQIELKTVCKWSKLLITGQFDSSSSSNVELEINNLINNGKVFIAIDLSGVDHMSSAGLRVLLSAMKLVKQKQGNVVLINPRNNVREVLDLSGFLNLFQMLNNEQELIDI